MYLKPVSLKLLLHSTMNSGVQASYQSINKSIHKIISLNSLCARVSLNLTFNGQINTLDVTPSVCKTTSHVNTITSGKKNQNSKMQLLVQKYPECWNTFSDCV